MGLRHLFNVTRAKICFDNRASIRDDKPNVWITLELVKKRVNDASSVAKPVDVTAKRSCKSSFERFHENITFPAAVANDQRRTIPQNHVEQRGHCRSRLP